MPIRSKRWGLNVRRHCRQGGRRWCAGCGLSTRRERGLRRRSKNAGLDPIFLLAPTSDDQRIKDVGVAGSGYIYYVSLKGVTGSAALDFDEVARRIP